MPQGVIVNLVFDSEETRELGISGHVCELQLVTRDFAAIMQVLGDSNSRLENDFPSSSTLMTIAVSAHAQRLPRVAMG